MSGALAHVAGPRIGVGALPPSKLLRSIPLPKLAERVLDNGLRVVAIRKPGVPMVEVRLRTFASVGRQSSIDRARRRLWGRTLLAGTTERDLATIAQDLQRLGAGLGGGADAEEAALGGSVLATGLPAYLALLAEVLTASTFPAAEVALERDRCTHEVILQRSQPATIARLALTRRVYGDHPYGAGLPEPEAFAAVTPAVLRRYARERIGPGGATLVLVGDLRPAATLDVAEAALGGHVWPAGKPSPGIPTPPPIRRGPIQIVDRPGAVQSNLRLGGPALPRRDPGFLPLSLANLIYGGYFSSRLVANIREDKGYTYSPHSGIEHSLAASLVTVSADVATEVTAAALLEIAYEQGRMATTAVGESELEDAKRYLLGSIVLSLQPQAGLAAYLTNLLGQGLELDYIRTLPTRVAAVTAAQVREAAATYLGPAHLVSVVVGDLAAIEGSVGSLGEIEPVPSP